jgi:hypothetical protein
LNDLVLRAGRLATKEVRGEPISDEEYDWIRNLPGAFDRRLLLPADQADYISPDDKKDLKMALIADVATHQEPPRYLLEGIGYPQRLTVLVKDYWGGTRLTRGFIFSQYEFVHGQRLNDDEWREKVYNSSPELKGWEYPWYSELRP